MLCGIVIEPVKAPDMARGLHDAIMAAYNDALKKNATYDLVVADATALHRLEGK